MRVEARLGGAVKCVVDGAVEFEEGGGDAIVDGADVVVGGEGFLHDGERRGQEVDFGEGRHDGLEKAPATEERGGEGGRCVEGAVPQAEPAIGDVASAASL